MGKSRNCVCPYVICDGLNVIKGLTAVSFLDHKLTTIIYAMDVVDLEPDAKDWSGWLDSRRIHAAHRFKQSMDRARCIGAGLLLSYAVRCYDEKQNIPQKVKRNAAGKPWLPNMPGFHFNISHSGKWAICAAGNRALGVDIEQVRRDKHGVVNRFFSPSEQEYLQSFAEEQQGSGFIELWVLRESYAKATGLGLRLPMRQFSIQMNNGPLVLHNEKRASYSLALCDFVDRDYCLGLAVKGKEIHPQYIIKYVSHEAVCSHLEISDVC